MFNYSVVITCADMVKRDIDIRANSESEVFEIICDNQEGTWYEGYQLLHIVKVVSLVDNAVIWSERM